LPFVPLDNALNTDVLSRGEQLQGYGIFGTARVRGTFVEPHFLAAYLATMLPLAYGLAAPGVVRRRLALAAAGAIIVALLLAASAPAWMALALGCTAAGCAWAVALGRILPAAALASALAALVFAGSLLVADPAPLAAVTGRSEAALDTTSRFRTDNWREALDVWATRPALGFGPGQSAIQLAPARQADPAEDVNPNVLGSAHGLWAAALVDTGVVGLGLWILFLGALVAAGWRLILRRPGAATAALVASATTGLLAAQVSGDRLELRVWALAGLVLGAAAVAGGHDAGGDAGERHEQPGAEAEQSPGERQALTL